MKFDNRTRFFVSRVCALLFAVTFLYADFALQAGTAKAESALADFIARLKRKENGGAAAVTNSNSGGVAGSKVTTVTEVVVDRNIAPMLAENGASSLRAAADLYRSIIAQGGFPKVPNGAYKKGSTGKGVIALNRRLYLEGYLRAEATQGEFAAIVTSATADAVSRFQQNMGLADTGKVDGPTLAALNVPAAARLRTIEANIARLEIYGTDLGERYIIVNIPAQQIETVTNGRVYSRHNAIVGRPSRPSPVVMTALSDINFNPYWNAPVSIVEQDIIPKLRSGSSILTEMNMRVFDGVGGPEINPRSVNWRRVDAANYHFRQEPGENNAMATAKINFQSPFGIYMHDTPEKQLFNSGSRFFSSGCIRVQDMPLMLDWILNGQDGIRESEIAALAETLERRDVKLATPPQLRVVYLTAWPSGNGTVAFRNDVYELDGTGFIMGQPMPVGERSPDGQRYVLKPLPRMVAQLDDNEAGGFSLFGFRKQGTRSSPSRSLFSSSADKNASATTTKTSVTKSKTAAKSKTGNDRPGLFDWTTWRKEQASLSKSKKVVKKTAAKSTKKPGESTAEKKVASKEKPATAKKKITTETAKATDTAKKPAVKKADDCKPDKDGKLPAGCKTADAAKKPKVEAKPKAETATN